MAALSGNHLHGVLALYDSKQAVYRENAEVGACCFVWAQGLFVFGHFRIYFFIRVTSRARPLVIIVLQHYYQNINNRLALENMLIEW